MGGEHLAQHAERTRVERIERATPGTGDGVPQEPGDAECADPLVARRVGIGGINRLLGGPCARVGRERAVCIVEERPREVRERYGGRAGRNGR